ncbi:hypothetical protein [Nonomuraea sp. NPDC050783]|uniref:hypothetical protein n=1 Tax=Nonomuraea sp. NPDC050783 TaxID=3154634 RepID=UPI0034654037
MRDLLTAIDSRKGTMPKSFLLATWAGGGAVPLGRDQGEVARHVGLAGAGVTVSRNASPRTIARAVARVLGEPSYRRQAERLAAAIAAETATDRAVAELEALAGRPAGDERNVRR